MRRSTPAPALVRAISRRAKRSTGRGSSTTSCGSTTEPGQLALELERAQALGYDLIKTYVRLPFQAQREIVDWAHLHGLPVTSHYHYPALAFGGDGMEHIGASSRLGYSRTVSALGRAYQDVTALFAASGAWRTPTLFHSAVLYAQDRSLVDDPRIRALYPPWEYERLRLRAAQFAGTDNSLALERAGRTRGPLPRHSSRRREGGERDRLPIDFNAVSLHMNLRGMVKFGMTPFEALTTATRSAGECLEQPLGVVAPGMLADLVVVDGDPLSRIEDAAAVRLVVKNGLVLEMPTILGPFAETLRAEEPTRVRVATSAQPFWWHDTNWVRASRTACCEDVLCAPAAHRRFFAEVVSPEPRHGQGDPGPYRSPVPPSTSTGSEAMLRRQWRSLPSAPRHVRLQSCAMDSVSNPPASAPGRGDRKGGARG